MVNHRWLSWKEHRSVSTFVAQQAVSNMFLVYGLLSLQHRTDLGVKDVSLWIPERWGMLILPLNPTKTRDFLC